MQKKNMGLIIIIVLFGLIILGLIGYICYNKEKESSKNIENEITNNNDTTQNEIKEDLLTQAEQLLDKFGFNEDIGCGYNIYDRFYYDSFKKAIVLKKVSDSVKKQKKCSEIYSEVLDYNPLAYKGKNGVCSIDKETNVIPYDEVNKIYKEMYGEDISKEGFATANHLSLFYSFYDYNQSLNSFVQLECGGCGGACGADAFTVKKIKNAYTKGDLLIVEVYYNALVLRTTYLSDGEHKSVSTLKDHIILSSKNIIDAKKEIEEQHLDKLDVYEVVFTKKDENYIFKSLAKKLS